MTARILVVDDIEVNRRLLEVRLAAEYFEVVTAASGQEALAIAATSDVDLVLLDVMMPDLDGYEVCRRLKADPKLQHIPVVLVSALDQPQDRVTGLEAGADDFLTKPAGDLQLFSRVRGLTRLKMMQDEVRRRAATALTVVSANDAEEAITPSRPGRAVAFLSEHGLAERLSRHLRGEIRLSDVADGSSLLEAGALASTDVAVVDLALEGVDPLRLISQLRSQAASRRLPILVIAAHGDEKLAARALEIGATDYLQRPIDRNEFVARLRTQVRRRRYDERLRRSIEETIEMAVIDPLTGLSNRRFFDTHLARAAAHAQEFGAPFSLLTVDIDHFKRINDGWGHDAGDGVLKTFAERLKGALRSSDLPCRFGGEEFVVLMPGAEAAVAAAAAERLREAVAGEGFLVEGEMLTVTISIGYAQFAGGSDDAASVLKRADAALYEAKRQGRNRVVGEASAEAERRREPGGC